MADGNSQIELGKQAMDVTRTLFESRGIPSPYVFSDVPTPTDDGNSLIVKATLPPAMVVVHNDGHIVSSVLYGSSDPQKPAK